MKTDRKQPGPALKPTNEEGQTFVSARARSLLLLRDAGVKGWVGRDDGELGR